MVRVSVIMAAYNAASTVSNSVRSALISMSQSDEIVVVVDANDQQTHAALGKVKDKRLRVFLSPISLGAGEARNLGVKHSLGEYLAILDADDFSAPWRIASQVRHLRRCNCEIVFGGELYLPLRKNPPFQILNLLGMPIDSSEPSLAFDNRFVNSTMFCKRRTFEELGGYSSRYPDDLFLWARALAGGKRMHLAPGFVAVRRLHSNQLSRSAKWAGDMEGFRQVTEELRKTSIGALMETPSGRLRIWRKYLLGSKRILLREVGLFKTLKSLVRRDHSVYSDPKQFASYWYR